MEVNCTGQVDFNKAMNRMLRRAQGELVVSVQDYIDIEPTGLEQFWTAHRKNPGFYTAPVGKMVDDGVKWDWRKHREYECTWNEWEIDYGSAPLAALKDIGGFDETLDDYWGFDNVNVGYRAFVRGYKFYNLQKNVAHAVDHDSFMVHPFRELRNPQFHNERLQGFTRNPVLPYVI